MKNVISFGLLVFLLSACHHAGQKKNNDETDNISKKISRRVVHIDSVYIDPSEINSNPPRQFVADPDGHWTEIKQ